MIWIFEVVLLGLIAGFLVNYLTDVLPVRRNLERPLCVYCHEQVKWGDYFLFKKCNHCEKQRSIRSKLVQFLFPVIFILLYLLPIERMNFWVEALVITYFSVIAITDIEYRVILHPVSLVGAAIGMFVGIYLHDLKTTLLGGIVGFGIMLLLYFLGIGFAKILEKSRGQEVEEIPLGFGDVNLAGVLGLILGWPGITAGLLLAILLGGFFSIMFIFVSKLTRRYQPFLAIPYAPFLLLGALILLFHP